MIIPVAYMSGAAKVIVVQRSRPRMEAAQKFGADAYICSSEEDAVSRVLAETGGLGADVIFTANPSPQSHAEALNMGAHGSLPRHHQQAIDLIAARRPDIRPYISHRFPLDKIGAAFAAAEGHQGMRVVVQP